MKHSSLHRGHVDLETLRERYARLITDIYPGKERLPQLVAHVLRHGEMARGDARFVTGTSERSAISDLGELISGGSLKSATPKWPLRIALPLDSRERLFPNLFTDAAPIVPIPPHPPMTLSRRISLQTSIRVRISAPLQATIALCSPSD
jgi:hypothetical protein